MLHNNRIPPEKSNKIISSVLVRTMFPAFPQRKDTKRDIFTAFVTYYTPTYDPSIVEKAKLFQAISFVRQYRSSSIVPNRRYSYVRVSPIFSPPKGNERSKKRETEKERETEDERSRRGGSTKWPRTGS